jgi:iron complex outermembrane receptor protein/outer membrane receptor for ferrienterochelin and colicins
VVNVITKKAFNLDEWTGVLEDNYFLQEKSEYGNTNQTNAFLMGPIIPGKLGVSVRADYLDRRDDDSINDERFVKHQAGNFDATVQWHRLILSSGSLMPRVGIRKNPTTTNSGTGASTVTRLPSQHAWYGDYPGVEELRQLRKSPYRISRAGHVIAVY